MISSILIGGGVVAIAAACNNDKTSDPTKDEGMKLNNSLAKDSKSTSTKTPSTNSKTSSSNGLGNKNQQSHNNHQGHSTGSMGDSSAMKDSKNTQPTNPIVKPPITANNSKTPSIAKKDPETSQKDSTTMETSNAKVTIYPGTKIKKESENKYLLQIYIKDADNKFAQVTLKPKGETQGNISSQFTKIISGFVAVYFNNIDVKKEYELVDVKISDTIDGKNPKLANIEEAKKVIIKSQEETSSLF